MNHQINSVGTPIQWSFKTQEWSNCTLTLVDSKTIAHIDSLPFMTRDRVQKIITASSAFNVLVDTFKALKL